jgi:hypothetical protein
VAGIETDAKSLGRRDGGQDCGQVLEAMSQATPLAGRGLQQDPAAKLRAKAVNRIQGSGHPR